LDKRISNKHARVYPLKDDRNLPAIVDLSTNGTWLNGKKLLKNEITHLKDGDRIQLCIDGGDLTDFF